jgi:hypothetical protein
MTDKKTQVEEARRTERALKLSLEALEAYGTKHAHTYGLDGAWDKEIMIGTMAVMSIRKALASEANEQPAQEDPCPGCRKGGVCRTPKCGRLKLPVDHPLRSEQPAQQTDSSRDDQETPFEAWWEKHGQFLRAGGGQYEKTFAWHAWCEAAKPAPVAPPREQQELAEASVEPVACIGSLNEFRAMELVNRGFALTDHLYASPPETARLLREIAALSANALDDYKMIQSLMAERKPLTDEQISSLWDDHTVPVFGKTGINPIVFARAIEAAHAKGDA